MALVIIVGLTIGIVYLGWQIASNSLKAAAYHQALPCVSGHGATSTDCLSYQTMQVTNKDTVELENLPDLCYLDLQNAAMPRLRVEVDSGLYGAAPVGSTVSVKFWRGKAMIVTGGGTRSGTENHPDRENHHDWLFIVIFGLGDWLFVSGYISEKRKRIRNSMPDVPWVATSINPTRFGLWDVIEDPATLTMTRWPHNSPVLFLCLGSTVLLFTGFCAIYFTLHPAEFAAYFWLDAIIEVVLGGLAYCCWYSNHKETQASNQGTLPQLQFSRGGESVLRNQKPQGAVQRIYLEEQVYDDGRGVRLKVAVNDGETIHLGGAEMNDLASIRPFATHLATFLDLPLEFTKEEKPG